MVANGFLGRRFGVQVWVILYHGVVWYFGHLGIAGGLTVEEERTVDKHPPLDGVVLLDDSGMQEGHEEYRREDAEACTHTHRDRRHVPSGLLVQPEFGGALVDDGEGADGSGNEEEERRGVDGPRDGVSSQVNNELDKHEDGRGKAGRNGGSHPQTCKDGTKTPAAAPAPFDLGRPDGCNTNTGDGRDKRIGTADMGGMPK